MIDWVMVAQLLAVLFVVGLAYWRGYADAKEDAPPPHKPLHVWVVSVDGKPCQAFHTQKDEVVRVIALDWSVMPDHITLLETLVMDHQVKEVAIES
jgi:hypothetical protein